MNRFLKKCLWFLGIVVFINLFYLFILLKLSPTFKKAYDISKLKNQDYDLIILGNSMALDGIDAEYISQKGIKTYNLAIAGCHVSTSLNILDAYIKKNQKPKMVVLGLSSAAGIFFLNPNPFDNPEVDFFYKPNIWGNIKNPPLLNFQWLAIEILKILISKEHRNAILVQGQYKTKKVIPDNSTFDTRIKEPKYYDDPYFNKIVLLCKKNNIQFLAVEMTGSNESQNSLAFIKEYRLADSNKITIYNLNNHEIATSLINPNTDYLAHDHLNVFGARKETQFLFEKIIQPNYTK